MIALCAVLAGVVALILAGGGGSEDRAIELVPADAYVYAHADLDPDSSQVKRALSLASGFPHLDAISRGILRAVAGDRIHVQRDLLSTVGDEAAVAEIPAPGGAPQPLLLVAVDHPGAGGLAHSLGAGTGGIVSAERDGFLLVGPRAAVRAAGDTAAGKAGSLADDDAAQEVRSSLPDERLADIYVSRDGIGRLLAGRQGAAGTLDTFADFGASQGLAAAAVAQDNGIEVQLSSSLDPEEARAAPPFFAAFPEFSPQLASALPADTLAMLDIGDPSQTARALLDQADAAVPGISAAFDRLDRQLSRAGGIGIEHGLLPLLGGEAAAAVAPARPVPYVTLIFDGVDEQKANEAMASLQAPLIGAVNPAATGQAPALSQSKIGGVTVHSVRLSAAVDLTYAVSAGRLLIATDPRGVEQALEGSDDLASQDSYRTVTSAGFRPAPRRYLFLNLRGAVFSLPRRVGWPRISPHFPSPRTPGEA